MLSKDFQNFLAASILPFIRRKMPFNHRLFMDNDPKHMSHSTRKFILLNDINHFETPPQWPDLMPIEMVIWRNFYAKFLKILLKDRYWKVWNDLKRETEGVKNKKELIRRIAKWWKKKWQNFFYRNSIIMINFYKE